MTLDEATKTLAAYRADHVIDPEYPANTRFQNYCRTCGIGIYPIKGGFRHDPDEIKALSRLAPTAGLR